jgi:transposase
MRTFRLTSRQRRSLLAQLKTARDARVVKRVFALLALDRGTPPMRLATTLGVTRQTLYNWINRFEIDGGADALADRPRPGRPTKWTESAVLFLKWSLEQRPDAMGYPSGMWTVPLLREHVASWMGIDVSDSTMRHELHRLGYMWKRPRYVLHPDPDREKKTQDSPANSMPSEEDSRACPRRNRRAALPASARRLGPTRTTGAGLVERSQRTPRDLRHAQPSDRTPRARLSSPPAGPRVRRIPSRAAAPPPRSAPRPVAR